MDRMQTEINEEFQLAVDFILQTNRSLFLTGKAGTGKTTFLKYILQKTTKNAVVVAPTGVAAINAGGVTMHSFFQLPFNPFVPEVTYFTGPGKQYADPHSLFETTHFNSSKIKLYKSLELLVIDEVSMVRCDMLDCIDVILRRFRKSALPFGGVQVLFIGDLFQLPPVAREWDLLKNYYESPFFFSARVIQNDQPVYIELQKIYRQNEMRFIQLLNRLRNNEMNEDDYNLLQEHYAANFIDDRNDYITLTTHNYKAEKVNDAELRKLETEPFVFKAEVSGDFPESMYPMEYQLQLKAGAQVMFIKNDSDPMKRYFNGKLATITSINENTIQVKCKEDELLIEVEKETWNNIRYRINPETNAIEEEVIGHFTHYPLRLAWAITIHKSQGLTFKKAIIDAGQAFAAGQVYVALSRCVDLEGIILQSRILPHAVKTDERILAFEQSQKSTRVYALALEAERRKYRQQVLMEAFDWSGITHSIKELNELMQQLKTDASLFERSALFDDTKIERQLELIEKLAVKANNAISRENDQELIELMQRAIPYFCSSIKADLIEPFQAHVKEMQHRTGTKGYLKKALPLALVWEAKIKHLEHLDFNGIRFYSGPSFITEEAAIKLTDAKATKAEKGATYQETLHLYKAGKTVAEIAALRNLAPGTIEGHLAKLVALNELDIFTFLNEQQILKIAEIALQPGYEKSSAVKEHFRDAFSYSQIRMALDYVKNK